jgi:hypothetical protein
MLPATGNFLSGARGGKPCSTERASLFFNIHIAMLAISIATIAVIRIAVNKKQIC